MTNPDAVHLLQDEHTASVEAFVAKKHATKYGNGHHSIDDLPLTESQKKYVLEWLAWKYWNALLKIKVQDGHCKSYDPLAIEEHVAHSYVFDLESGGRHHPFSSLAQLEGMLDEDFRGSLPSPKTCSDCSAEIEKSLESFGEALPPSSTSSTDHEA